MPSLMDDLDDLFERIFPTGTGFIGTHMTIECSSNLKYLNNAAYFLNGTEKHAQGYRRQEQGPLISACRSKLHQWKKESMANLIAALRTL